MPIGGVMGMTSNNTLPSSSLKPEMTTEYEFGLSGSFFGNRLTVDASYYNRMTKIRLFLLHWLRKQPIRMKRKILVRFRIRVWN